MDSMEIILFSINLATSLATFGALYYTIRAYSQSKKALDESKRQWDEAHRPNIIFSIDSYAGDILLRVENCGPETAYDVCFRFDDFLRNHLMAKQLRDNFTQLEYKSIIIGANQSKYFNLHPTIDEIDHIEYRRTKEVYEYKDILEWYNKNKDRKFRVFCTYSCYKNKQTYNSEALLSIGEYLGEAIQVIDSPLKALLEIDHKTKKTHRLLESIKLEVKECNWGIVKSLKR